MSAPWAWPGSVVTRVVDGDSIIARVTRDIGFHGTVTFEQRLRLNRVNSPAISTDAGKRTAAYVTSRVTGVVVDITTTGPYKYRDEWMAEVVLPDGTNLSDVLVGLGYAVSWDGKGPRPGG